MTKSVFASVLVVIGLLALPHPSLWAQEGNEGEEPEQGQEQEQEEEQKQETPPVEVDAARLLTDLQAACKEKSAEKVRTLLESVVQLGKTSKDEEELEPIAKELGGALKFIRDDMYIESKVLEALGELRTKTGEAVLKRYAFKKTRNETDEKLKAAALIAIGKMRDPKMISQFEDECKARENEVAKAAYEAFENFGPLPGRTRKQITEVLMKRLEAEYPSAGGQGSGNVSQEARDRWDLLAPVIVKSLQAVTRETTINDIDNWREWWKEAKRDAKLWRDSDKD